MSREPYMKAFVPTCDWGHCKKLASYAVFGSSGCHFGDYCEEHANVKMEELGAKPESSENT